MALKRSMGGLVSSSSSTSSSSSFLSSVFFTWVNKMGDVETPALQRLTLETILKLHLCFAGAGGGRWRLGGALLPCSTDQFIQSVLLLLLV